MINNKLKKQKQFGILLSDEKLEIEEMEKTIRFQKHRLKVKEQMQPFLREGSQLVYIDKKTGRYRIRIPTKLRTDSTEWITAYTEQEVFEKVYVYLFGEEVITIRDLFEILMERKRGDPDLSTLTIERYEQDWNKYYDKEQIVDMPIDKIKGSDLKIFFKNISSNRKLTRTCFNNIKSITNAVFDLAVELDIVSNNISRSVSCRDLRFKAVNNSNVRYTDEERKILLNYLDNMPKKSGYEYGIALMFCLCIRIGELRALRWTDIDYYRNTITIEREIVRQKDENGHCYYEEVNHTKGGEHGMRCLPLSEKATQILNELKTLNPEGEYICCNRAGHHLDGNRFNDHLRKVTAAANIPYLSSHKIRFWSVTALSRATGGDIQTVMYAAGHSNKNTTLHYIRAVQSDTKLEEVKRCFS